MPTSILVTGGAGYIGSHTTRQLLAAGHRVVVVDDLSTGHRWAIPPGCHFVQGDAADEHLLERTITGHGIEAVIHFAGSIVVSESVRDPLKYYRNNICLSRTLIASCLRLGVARFIYSSSAAVYGIPDAVPIAEEAPTRPINPYGTTKLVTEWILRDVAASAAKAGRDGRGFRHVALRYFNVAGASLDGTIGEATPIPTHLIKIAAEAACGARDKVTIYGADYPTADGTCVRDYIHVEDLARAHLEALDYLEAGGGSVALNCGYGHGFSVRLVLATVARVTGVKLSVEEGPRRAGDPMTLVADTSKIRGLLGWKPEYDDLDLICSSACRWEQNLRAGLAGRAGSPP